MEDGDVRLGTPLDSNWLSESITPNVPIDALLKSNKWHIC